MSANWNARRILRWTTLAGLLAATVALAAPPASAHDNDWNGGGYDWNYRHRHHHHRDYDGGWGYLSLSHHPSTLTTLTHLAGASQDAGKIR